MAPPRDYRFQIEKSKSSRRSRRTQNYNMEKSRYRKAHHTPSENYDKWYANEKFKSYNGSCLPRPVPSRSFEVQSQRDSFGCRSSEFDSNKHVESSIYDRAMPFAVKPNMIMPNSNSLQTGEGQ